MNDIQRKRIEKAMVDNNFSGLVSIRKDGKILFNKAMGYRDRANHLHNDLDTRFGIASGTKLFTALGIALLVQRGQLNFKDKVLNILSVERSEYDKSVTVEHLLTHSSGLPDYFDEDKVEDFDNFTVSIPWYHLREPKDYFPVLPEEGMKFSPGEKFNYNNSGYVLLAALIAEVSGKSYSSFIEEEILKPLGMVNSGFYPMNKLPGNVAIGYIEEEIGWRSNLYNLPIVGGGDGGLFTTLEDIYSLWDGLLDHTILSKEITDQLFKSRIQTKPNSDSFYGFGVWIKDAMGIPREEYIMGVDAGISFKSVIIREKNLSYTVISNTGDGAWPILKSIVEHCID